MNDLFYSLGIVEWKGLLTALMLPPVPLLLLVLLAALLFTFWRRRRWAGALLLSSCVLLWLSATPAVSGWLKRTLTPSPPVLSQAARDALKADRRVKTVIVVLGAGRDQMLLEYGLAAPKPYTLERLRYGIWLGRRTGLPVAYSGGLSPGSLPGPTEAEVAQRVASEDFGYRLAWTEGRSRNTVENARFALALLRPEGVQRIVLVTHDFHMRRALRAFERVISESGAGIELLPAPLGVYPRRAPRVTDWLPDGESTLDLRVVVREWLGWLAGA